MQASIVQLVAICERYQRSNTLVPSCIKTSDLKEIEKNFGSNDYYFQSGSNHPTTLKKFLNDTKEVTDWHSLGIQLEIPTSHLRHIEDNYGSNAKRCKMEVIDYWLQNDPEHTRSKLAQAVEDMGGHANVVQTLRAQGL